MFGKQCKSGIALFVILAALIIPFISIAPASATPTTGTFYGGTMPTTNGGIVQTINFNYENTDYLSDGITINIMRGTSLISSMYLGVTGFYPSSYFSQAVTAGYSNTLLPGETYTFTISVGYGTVSNVSATYATTWPVTFGVYGLDSSALGTVLIVNNTVLTYSSVASGYQTLVLDGSVFNFNYESSVYTSSATKAFTLSSVNASSPVTITASTNIFANYTVSTSLPYYTVTVKGPYFENGQVATNYTVNYNLLYANNTIYSGSLTSTLTAGSENILSVSSPFAQLSWNASSASSTFNATRVYRFANGANGLNDTEVYLYILDPSKPAYQYTFSITDFYGMVNPYMQSVVSPVGGSPHVVERVSLNDAGGGFATFVMQQYQLYSVAFVCQQGTYTQDFTPNIVGTPGQNVISLSVSAGNFPVSNTTGIPLVFANRTNSNTIYASYFDPNATTSWVNLAITHLQGSTSITDYVSSNSSSSSQSWTWSQADANTNYYVTITAYQNGAVKTYPLTIQAVNGDNPWAGIDWSFLGRVFPTLPTTYTGWGGIDPTQMIAVFLIIAALGIGSYFSTGASCLICWVIGGILLSMGWWQGSIPLFAFALVITILILIDEYKKGNFAL